MVCIRPISLRGNNPANVALAHLMMAYDGNLKMEEMPNMEPGRPVVLLWRTDDQIAGVLSFDSYKVVVTDLDGDGPVQQAAKRAVEDNKGYWEIA